VRKRGFAWSIIAFVIICGIGLGLFFSLKQPLAGGITVTDDLGRVVTVKNDAARIVSLSPGATEMIFTLGGGDRLVGVTNQCDYPEAARTKLKVGDYWGSNVEQIAAQSPDLIFTEAYQVGLVEELEQLGMAVVVLQPTDVAGLLRDILLLGQAMGDEDGALALQRDIKQGVDAIIARVKDAPRPGIFYEGDSSNGIWTVGQGTFQDELINLAGGRNVGADQPGYFEVSIEYLISLNDDIQLIIWGDMGEVGPETVRDSPPWMWLTAMQEGRVYAFDPDLANRPGARLVAALTEYARIIHPELFSGD
jgi:iron complex transport system substrate-binding protein